jgi:hypothetical protein
MILPDLLKLVVREGLTPQEAATLKLAITILGASQLTCKSRNTRCCPTKSHDAASVPHLTLLPFGQSRAQCRNAVVQLIRM